MNVLPSLICLFEHFTQSSPSLSSGLLSSAGGGCAQCDLASGELCSLPNLQATIRAASWPRTHCPTQDSATIGQRGGSGTVRLREGLCTAVEVIVYKPWVETHVQLLMAT